MQLRMRIAAGVLLLFAPAGVWAAKKPAEPKPEPPDMTIRFDIDQPTYHDRSKSKSFPDLGYAGCIADEGPVYCDEFFVKHPDETWETFKKAGAYVVKLWGADGQWARDRERAKITYDWRKKHNVKTLLCLEAYDRTVDSARTRILEFVQWIVDNGYTNTVAGFELGNEPYWGSQPEQYADRWAAIVPDMKRIWPEAQIGFILAELESGDPDLQVVRRRFTNVEAILGQDSGLGLDKINNWSGRFVMQFKDTIKYCSHVVYHFYGGFGPYGCTFNGIRKIRHFAEIFPEVAGKKVWITEWRFTSDMELRGQQSFRIAEFDALYMLMIICMPEVEGISAHQCGQLSGGFYYTDGRGRWTQRAFGLGGDMYSDPDWTGHPKLEAGPAGPTFRYFNEALMDHPHVIARGRRKDGSLQDNHWHCDWGCGDHVVSWVLLANPERTSAALLVCNCGSKPFLPPLETKGCTFGVPHYRVYRCKSEQVDWHQWPGEPRIAWQEEHDGKEGEIVIPPDSVCTVEFPIRKEAKR